MPVIFYPRDMGRWRKDFDFHPSITLTPKQKTDHKVFKNREELIAFLKEHDVRLDDPDHPLKFERCDETKYLKGHPHEGELFIVHQWTVQGWFRDDYR